MSLSREELDRLSEDGEAGPARALKGGMARLAGGLALALAVYALYWTQYNIATTFYRPSFLAFVLVLTFLLFPGRPSAANRDRVAWVDGLLIALVVVAVAYLVLNVEAVKTRSTRPQEIEVVLGGALILLILEATRRTTGWALPLITVAFLAYAYFGQEMPEPFDHRGYSVDRIVGQNYLTLEGIFSTPLDVAATFIILFTIYGAVLEYGGAGKFFIDWAFALFGKKPSASAPGRAVVASGFLLGTVSGSGVATTVTLGSLAWPMLKRSGYTPNVAGGMLSASGIGATLSPPTLGAAAFIIAEYLEVPYLDILVMAAIPTLLYYLSCWLMVEADARRLNVRPVKTSDRSLGELTRSQGYHFLSLGAIAGLLVIGMSAFMAVFWSIVIAFVLSLPRRDSRLVTLPAAAFGVAVSLAAYLLGQRVSAACFIGLLAAGVVSSIPWLLARRQGGTTDPIATRLPEALISGVKSVVGIAATCACAGIIVSVVTLTGLGLKLSGLIVDLGGGSPAGTILLAALAMWLLGTAVPVTASYVIAAVMLVPALTSVGVALPAAHMFLFYYAVLADVSPPTALAPFAASAITGGTPFATMLQAWKYSLPAFLVPFMFCLSPEGTGLLMFGSWWTILSVTLTSCLAVAALAAAFGGWILRPANRVERGAAGLAGVLLLVADPLADLAGLGLGAAVLALHRLRVRRDPRRGTETAPQTQMSEVQSPPG